MKKGLNELVLIIDESGSMYSIINDAIGGYNTYIEEQQKETGEARVTTVFFSNNGRTEQENVDIKDVSLLNENVYKPNGSTALLHTIGHTITSIGNRLKNTPEESRPEKIIISILTDGEENSSNSHTPLYTREKIKEMIVHQKEKYNWEFVFLGANQDAFSEASSIGITRGDTVNFAYDGEGVRGAYTSMSKLSSKKRSKL